MGYTYKRDLIFGTRDSGILTQDLRVTQPPLCQLSQHHLGIKILAHSNVDSNLLWLIVIFYCAKQSLKLALPIHAAKQWVVILYLSQTSRAGFLNFLSEYSILFAYTQALFIMVFNIF